MMDLNHTQKEIEKIKLLVEKLKSIVDEAENIIIIGNGGSNSIASHIAQDYTKVLGKKAISFSDPSRLTCYMNDYGIEDAYMKFIEHFSQKNTLVILISSSGESKNIVNAAQYCNENNLDLITLSGFDSNNLLRSFNSKLSYWVDSKDYGIVECVHQIFLHSILGSSIG